MVNDLRKELETARYTIGMLNSEVEAGNKDEKELFACRDRCAVLESAVSDERDARERLQSQCASLSADKRSLARDVEELKQVNHNLNIEITTLKAVIQMLADR
jgi:predicted  nucleic acid-binding Zn-ribbon protein